MEAPKLPSFFKQNQHRRFEYAPRYYNERRERIEEIRRKYDNTKVKEKFSGQDLKIRLSSEWRNAPGKKASRGTSLRLVVIMAALFLLSYLILFN